jgi:predicted enzyme related to lactoylglutathione lyase
MFTPLGTFSGVSVDDIGKAKDFYTNVLGLTLTSEEMGLDFTLPGDARFFIYQKPDHAPATFTVLNFVVADIDEAVDALVAKGVTFEMYPNMHQDAKGIARGKAANEGPDVAWFKDPAGNILSVLCP